MLPSDKKKGLERRIESSKEELANARENLETLKPLSLADTCATMVRNGNLADNFLIKLQDQKQKRNGLEAGVLIEQMKAKTAAVQSEAQIVASIVKGCTESIKGSKADVQADKYAACISIKLK